MRRETQNILLILVGGALLKISWTSTYLLYVKPAHQPWLIAGGAIMVILGAISIFKDVFPGKPKPVGHDHADEGHADLDQAAFNQANLDVSADRAGHDGHGHGGHDDHDGPGEHHHPARSAWLLLMPVLAIFLIAPPALGADSVMRNDNRAAASRSSGTDGSSLFPPLPKGDVVSIAMSDFAARAAWDSGKSLDNRTVKLTGFVVAQGETMYLARLSIACCAADAFPVKVKLDGPGVGGLKNDTWLEVTGQVQPGTATKDTDYVPSFTVSDMVQIPQPENPYEA
ncbi:TIGR03943 family putative permease subunit [Actinokineospora sp. HUAS TT18]|uniref:TIGR03943 family putative permease subunit n=1 Tax=Actinokineospora sp. HUAS TT18 TaxID=3447451 RepID=UPI003F521DC4